LVHIPARVAEQEEEEDEHHQSHHQAMRTDMGYLNVKNHSNSLAPEENLSGGFKISNPYKNKKKDFFKSF
jgi:hypothetical protein